MKKRVLFYRQLLSYNSGTNGGHLKVRDCFNHVEHSDKYKPFVFFSKDTRWFDNPGNYWLPFRDEALSEWKILPDDVLFFSGKDWEVLSEEERIQPPVPIINIVQPRHTREDDPRREFLKYPAIRIAKSEKGAEILKAHGVNGPLYVIPDSIDLSLFDNSKEKDIDLLILGLKQEALAKRIGRRIGFYNWIRRKGWRIEMQLPPKLPTRKDFIDLLSRAKTVLCLPLDDERGFEGFYLPALEAMALGGLVVVPHAIGNVGHCKDGINCIVPEFSYKDLVDKTIEALEMQEEARKRLIANGFETANEHSLENERKSTLALIENAYDIWKEFDLPGYSN